MPPNPAGSRGSDRVPRTDNAARTDEAPGKARAAGTDGSGTGGAASDVSTPSVARIYDYAVGGSEHVEVDRQATRAMLERWPDACRVARQNRAWLTRAVHHVASQGVAQFLDHGSGLPTQSNVHQVAQQSVPDSRVVYVDYDPVVLERGRGLLAEDGRTEVVAANMASVEEILGNPRVQELIDFTEPVAVLYVSALHCLPDEDDPGSVVRRVVDAVPSGSYLVLSHLVSRDPGAARSLTEFMRASARWGSVRTEDEVAEHFAGLQVCSPGLGNIREWRPDLTVPGLAEHYPDEAVDETIWEFGGVARKP